jgi:hypothetical protein
MSCLFTFVVVVVCVASCASACCESGEQDRDAGGVGEVWEVVSNGPDEDLGLRQLLCSHARSAGSTVQECTVT